LLPPPPRSLLLSSFQYFSTAISDYYDSNSQRVQPRVSWMEKVEKDDPQYRDRNTRNFCGDEELFRGDLEVLRSRYNQSEGLHTWQQMYGCELQANRSKGGFMQYGYEGRTFITFDKETLTWVAPDPQAQISQRRWDALPAHNQFLKSYLEEICLDWIRKYLSYGKEMLLRTAAGPEVEDGMETHICRVDGFYPREIDASWTRDGEVWLQDTFHGSVAPNADGTYHYWLSVRIDHKERGRYRCHVEHDGLQEPLDVAIKGERLRWE
uniref:Ig-like domain-containing protein n=1 Tax=Naja naja TaxID=35670 RepID=A0A8C6Y1X3_NAJNA